MLHLFLKVGEHTHTAQSSLSKEEFKEDIVDGAVEQQLLDHLISYASGSKEPREDREGREGAGEELQSSSRQGQLEDFYPSVKQPQVHLLEYVLSMVRA